MTATVPDGPGLFPEPEHDAPAEDHRTPGERRRARQLAAIHHGQHPLTAAVRYPIRLHADARRDGRRDDDGSPRCGGCALRKRMTGDHEGTFPKCTADARPRERTAKDGRVYRWFDYPRVTNGPGTDCAAWFPACVDYVPTTGSVGAGV